MYFKKLELIGFKSFADKTVLQFEPGVTAVVGPNGCGKSNIFDSIRWVLGEQSVKAMRGTSMEDVIFNGTSNKPALGFAEVSLTFSNENKFFPVDYDEIMITRRLFRSGESEYLMNKNQVRLKDINELLMGTGIASESYSLVEQGKIDLVLSSRPEDRRAIFDEAAGITKYKAKKKEALSKLEDTEENLVRLADIINEVQRQINSVERQAAKARRYQEHFQRLKGLEVKKALYELGQFSFQLQTLADKKSSSNQEEKELEGLIQKVSAQGGELTVQLNDIVAAIEAGDIEVLKADSITERLNDSLRVSHERIGEYEQRIKDLIQEKEHISSRVVHEQKRLDTLKQELFSFDDSLSTKKLQLKQHQEALEKIAQQIEAARKEISEAKKDILEITNQFTKVKNDSLKVTSGLTTLSTRKHRLEIERAKVGQEKEEAQNQLQTVQEQLRQKSNEIAKIQEALNQELSLEHSQQANLQKIEETLRQLDKDLSSLQSQKEFLENLKTKYASSASNREGLIILDAQDLKPGMGILGTIQVIDSVSDELAAKLSLKPKSASRVSCQLKVIDLDLERIIKEAEEVARRLREAKSKKDKLSTDIQSILLSISEKEKALKELEIQRANIQTQQQLGTQEATKLQEEALVVEEELSEVISEIASLTTASEKSQRQLQELESENKRLDGVIASNQDLISSLANTREKTIVDIAQLETTLGSFADKRNDLENSVRIIESSLAQDTQKEKSSDAQIEDCKKKIEQLSKEIGQAQSQIESTKATKHTAIERLEDLKQNKQEFVEKIKEKQSQINERNSDLNRIRQDAFELSSKEQEINFQIVNLKDRIEANYHVNLDTDIQGEAISSDEELSCLLDEIKTLKEKVDSYGVVNLVAIEEHEELKKRLEFLTSQQSDLVAAKESIHKAIAKINQTTRKMFSSTFEKIQVHFKDYFKLLFNGGDAQLFLTDENNILESGIEIVCRPPGKKLQNISLLSGGEKSLSAIALIFAVFKVRPSPFCVLDEIDAALDEANIDRYNRVLQEFLSTTQFIIITHNKKTITNADVMYGITMQESGVSRIVSVKFAKEKSGHALSSVKPLSKEQPPKEPVEKEPTKLS